MEVSVSRIELEHGVSTGINVSTLMEDMVPVQEEHEARLEHGIRLKEWEGMDYIEKALIVALRRNRLAIENLRREAEIREMERKNRKARKK